MFREVLNYRVVIIEHRVFLNWGIGRRGGFPIGTAHDFVDGFVVFLDGEGLLGLGVAGEAGFFGFGELDTAFAQFDGLETGEALADGAEFGCVDVGAAGQFEEAELELLAGQVVDGVMVGGFEVVTGGFVVGDLPGGAEVGEGADAEVNPEFFAGVLGGFLVGHGLAEVDELLFLGRGECGKDGVVAARVWRWFMLTRWRGERRGGRGIGNW